MARGKEIKTAELQETPRPMAAPEITVEDKIEALTLRLNALEEKVLRHDQYHFGRKPD